MSRPLPPETGRRRSERGVTYLALLIFVAVISAVLAATAQIISHAQQREREKQLLWVGDQIRKALVSYSKTAAGIDTFPRRLEDLVEDRRQAVVVSHLRRVYFDPMMASTEWGLILNPQQRIIGVHSRSTLTPIRSDNFPPAYAGFKKARTYAEWKFGVGDLLSAGAAGGKEPGTTPGALPGGDAAAEGAADAGVDAAGTPVQPTPRIGGIAAPTPGKPGAPKLPAPATPGAPAAPPPPPGIFNPGVLSPFPGSNSPFAPAAPAGSASGTPVPPAGAPAPAAPAGGTGAGRGGAAAVPTPPAAAATPESTPAAPADAEQLPPGDDAPPAVEEVPAADEPQAQD